jgi:hypothetical protein
MTARENFNIGDRVRLSPQGVKLRTALHARKGNSTGKIVGYGRSPEDVRILIDGNSRPYTFHMEFWERVEEMLQAHA